MLRHIRTGLAGLAIAASLATSAFAAGFDVNATTTGLALRGHDPVAYFTAGAPTPGDVNITAEHNGATYRFATKANRDAFKADPAKFVPQYGGFCAFGTAMGYKVDGDPQVWSIVDNKLYLNLSKAVQTRWDEDRPGFIKTADGKWTAIADKDPASIK